MKFALRPLAMQVYQFISPAQLLQSSEATDLAKQSTIRLAENLQLDFTDQYFKATKKKAQAAYVQATQSCVINMADKLHNYIAEINQLPLPKTAREECIAFYKIIEEQLLYLLSILQNSFTLYFNAEQKMPDCYLLQAQQYFLLSAGNLEKQIAKGIHPQLIQWITEPIKGYYKPGEHGGLSYGDYAYWKTLFEQLLSCPDADNNAWIQILILHNFNHGGFINYVLEWYQEPISQLETTTEKKEQWAKHIRVLNRLHPIPNLALHKGVSTCRQSILLAIQAEITVLESQPSNPQPANLPPSTKPFQTTLSVPQLATMVRLLVETGILHSTNQSVLFKDVCRNFTTRQQTDVSSESLRQKYYKPDSATISILKTHLSNMMGQLRTY